MKKPPPSPPLCPTCGKKGDDECGLVHCGNRRPEPCSAGGATYDIAGDGTYKTNPKFEE